MSDTLRSTIGRTGRSVELDLWTGTPRPLLRVEEVAVRKDHVSIVLDGILIGIEVPTAVDEDRLIVLQEGRGMAGTGTGRGPGNDGVEPTQLRITGIKDMDGVEALRFIIAAEDNETAAAVGSTDGRGGMVRPRTRSRARNLGIRPFPSGGVKYGHRVLPLVVLDAAKDN